MSRVEIPDSLPENAVAAVREVESALGEIPAHSLVDVLMQGDRAKKFQGITLLEHSAICGIMYAHDAKLPAHLDLI